jgi:hypothetical protein
MSANLASLLLSMKANQLGHDSVGGRGRRATSVLLVLSALLGYLAGVTGLADLIGKTVVAVLGILAGVSTTGAILALTMLKSGDHLRVAGEYELLFSKTVRHDEEKPEARVQHQELREAFDRVVEKTRTAGTSLTNGQVLRYERQARTALASEAGEANARKAKLLNG